MTCLDCGRSPRKGELHIDWWQRFERHETSYSERPVKVGDVCPECAKALAA